MSIYWCTYLVVLLCKFDRESSIRVCVEKSKSVLIGKNQDLNLFVFQACPTLMKLSASGQLSLLMIPSTANMTMTMPTEEQVGNCNLALLGMLFNELNWLLDSYSNCALKSY